MYNIYMYYTFDKNGKCSINITKPTKNTQHNKNKSLLLALLSQKRSIIYHEQYTNLKTQKQKNDGKKKTNPHHRRRVLLQHLLVFGQVRVVGGKRVLLNVL